MITRMAAELAAKCIVMGEHARTPLKRWFTEDIARAVLHDAPCPVLFVPSVPPDQREWLSRFALSKEKSILWGTFSRLLRSRRSKVKGQRSKVTGQRSAPAA